MAKASGDREASWIAPSPLALCIYPPMHSSFFLFHSALVHAGRAFFPDLCNGCGFSVGHADCSRRDRQVAGVRFAIKSRRRSARQGIGATELKGDSRAGLGNPVPLSFFFASNRLHCRRLHQGDHFLVRIRCFVRITYITHIMPTADHITFDGNSPVSAIEADKRSVLTLN